MDEKKIRVLIVDDSPVSRDVLETIIETDPDIKIIGFAINGKEAVDLTAELKPDIISMDLNMPIMNGYEAIEKIMAFNPTPILVVTTAEFEKDSSISFEALNVGALDIINRPSLPNSFEEGLGQDCLELISKLKLLSQVEVITHLKGKLSKDTKSSVEEEIKPQNKLIVVASSTGGPKSLREVFSRIPEDFTTPIVVVQHMSDGFIPGLIKWLDESTVMNVKVAENMKVIKPGEIYIAATGIHLKVRGGGILSTIDLPPVNGLKPCADILFESAAPIYKSGLLGVILSGMGNDGTKGSEQIKAYGGRVIAQDEATSVIFSMPRNSIDAGNVDVVKPVFEITDEIQNQLQNMH